MKKILSVLFLGILLVNLNPDAVYSAVATPAKSTTTTTAVATKPAAINVKPLDLVNNPSAYMRKRISMTSKFSKFSTLGLDYKPAFRSSDKYISFLFYRDDVVGTIPLSELKMFISRKTAESLPDIKEGTPIRVVGTVFSNALGDAWVDAESIEILNSKK